MKLYTRKLHNTEDLEQERRRLMRQKREMDKEPMLSMDDVLKKKKGSSSSGGGIGVESILAGVLPVSAPVIGIITKFINRRLAKVDSARNRNHPNVAVQDKNYLRSFAFDILLGYLKWKAIELSFKGAKTLIEKQKAKKAAMPRRRYTAS